MRETGTVASIAGLALVVWAWGGTAGAQAAQEGEPESRALVSSDWLVVVETEPAIECRAAAPPSASRNTRDGQEVDVQRGDTALFVARRPGAGVAQEVSFTGGYPFAEGSLVTMQIGGDRFDMFTRGEFAWSLSPEEDDQIVRAMKRGREATLTGRSSRGTTTEDTFSLSGFTDAMEEVEGNCATR